MSDTQGISHNRDDYSPKIRAWAKAIADVFHGGDEDFVWQRFFETRERNASLGAGQPVQTKARLHLRAVPATNNPSPETEA